VKPARACKVFSRFRAPVLFSFLHYTPPSMTAPEILDSHIKHGMEIKPGTKLFGVIE